MPHESANRLYGTRNPDQKFDDALTFRAGLW